MANKYIRHGATYNGDGSTSAEAAGSTVTITIASPGVVTWTGHGLAANAEISLTTTGALPTGLTANTKYYVRNPGTDTFELSATSGGASINTSGTQSGTHTAAGVGAWNNINVFNNIGTVALGGGSLAAGDVVYIRSKDASGNDITITLSSNTTAGLAAATSAAPVTWIIDDGTVWPGVDGIVKYTTSGAYALTLRINNILASLKQDSLIFESTATSPAASTALVVNNGTIKNAKFDWTAKTGTNRSFITMGASGVLISPHILWGRTETSAGNYGIISCASYAASNVIVVSPNIELTNSNATHCVFAFAESGGGQFLVIGGQVSGVGSSTGTLCAVVTSGVSGSYRVIGTQFPKTMAVSANDATSAFAKIECIGSDDGLGGVLVGPWGFATSRSDDNPPTLNASLPNSTDTKWSFRLYPKAANTQVPATLQTLKMFQGDAAILTLTQEVLIATSMSPTNANTWIEVSYVDNTTGALKYVSSRDLSGGSLVASSADWSADYWGAITCNKLKMSVTTPTSVKKDTPIIVSFCTALASVTANDIMFVDPDFGVA